MKRCEKTEKEYWVNQNTFRCHLLQANITRAQCKSNQKRLEVCKHCKNVRKKQWRQDMPTII